MKFFTFIILTFVILSVGFSFLSNVSAEHNQDKILAVYITGIGCPNCAFTDPVLLSGYTAKYPDLIIIEYEIYNLADSNQDTANQYFESYLSKTRAGVPLIIFNQEQIALGRFQVLDSKEIIESLALNDYPLPDKTFLSFNDLDLTDLPGKIKIWTKNRVLISGQKGNNDLLKNILTTDDLSAFLKNVDYEQIAAEAIAISGGQIEFTHAVKIDDWLLEWNGQANLAATSRVTESPWKSWYWLLIIALFLLISFFIYKLKIMRKRLCLCLSLDENQRNYLIILVSLLFLIGFFILAKNVSPDFLGEIGFSLPLPLFTIFIALIDGFNPCNLFVLTVLLGLLVSASHSRKKIYLIGYTFILVVFVVYFLFMAAWLNVFKYIGFITPLRIAIALIALVAGIINCKELIAFRKGITLMIQEQHKGPLMRRIDSMKELIKKGSTPTLILSSITLAVFASLVELPCTAGFPIIYTGILTGKVLTSSFSYYLYLVFYNLIYIVPLLVIITIFGYTFKGKQISQSQMQMIKFIGGFIMILLGLILLVNPSLIGISYN